MIVKVLHKCEEDVVRTMMQEIIMLSNLAIEDAIVCCLPSSLLRLNFESFLEFMDNIARDIEDDS